MTCVLKVMCVSVLGGGVGLSHLVLPLGGLC